MSLRCLGTRLLKYGSGAVKKILQREINSFTINNAINVVHQAAPPQAAPQGISRNFNLRNVGAQIGLQARRILIDNVLNRVTNSLAGELRKKAARRILYGDSGPFFALVGVSLASGTGILTKEEELEGVCWEIREAISKIKWHYFDVNLKDENITLDNISLGKPISKGANGVVYAAQLKTTQDERENNQETNDSITKFPFALKMMFNYDIQSNSMAILRAMYRETVPARLYYNNIQEIDWEKELSANKKTCPPHPNIVAMFSVFTDYIRDFEDSKNLYPMALPRRLNPDGEGRNMSLFLLMKRYETNLQEFLKTKPSTRICIQLFAQLLEGIAHLNAHGIAHRDIKSDNLLLDTSETPPILVISDFGCCLADKDNGLLLPYTSHDIDKGGNRALMPPEIINQTCGTFSVLNYTKSDLWAAGTVAYEIFGNSNPFYERNGLKSSTYEEEQLPKLSQDIPVIIRELIKNLLRRNPNKRLHPEIAANIVQLFLWAPSGWMRRDTKIPTSAEILQWLLSLTTKVLCEGRINNKPFGGLENIMGRRTYPEYLLISTFLCRVKLTNIRLALSWIQNNNYEMDY